MLLRLQTHNRVIGSVGDCPTATQTLLGEDTYWRQKDKKTLDTHNLPDEDTTTSLYAKKKHAT